MYNNPEFKTKIVILEDDELKGAFLKKNLFQILPCQFVNIQEYDKGIVGEYYLKRKHKIMAYDFDGKKLIPDAEYQSVVILSDYIQAVTNKGEIVCYTFQNKETKENEKNID